MVCKGRVQVGMDVDFMFFDVENIIDMVIFEDDLIFLCGVQYVFVGGMFVVCDGEMVFDIYFGQLIYG